jgi:hypothetical protein
MFILHDKTTTVAREPFTSDNTNVVIGREAGCDLQLPDPGVSNRHASIEKKPDGYYIRDLDSANGVIVNSQPATLQRLASGDLIELGSVRLQFSVIHPELGERRASNLMQVLLILVIIGSILSQLGIIGWIFSQPRPAHFQRGNRDRARQAQANANEMPEISNPETPSQPTIEAAPAPVAPPASADIPASGVPAVLNRKISIMGIERRDTAGAVQLQIRAMAQVGEPTLDAAAARISVQLFVRDANGSVVPSQSEPLWVNTTSWDNFSAKTFQVSLPVDPARFVGYKVCTFYRGEMQDMATSPGLVSLAPNSLP